ncbi:hypothetical protein [Inquilinus sp. CA228]|uniref:hypothetical protein n=1 Tax=Inquilinus sp. CA228 TaxID=3455609 RepID=UPI003F8CF4C7
MTEPLARFDGAAVWATLDPEHQAAIGAIALEIVAAMVVDRYVEIAPERDPRVYRVYLAFDAGDAVDLLFQRAASAVDLAAQLGANGLPRIPSVIGAICRDCGCTQDDACTPRCSWAEPDLCSTCKGAADV